MTVMERRFQNIFRQTDPIFFFPGEVAATRVPFTFDTEGGYMYRHACIFIDRWTEIAKWIDRMIYRVDRYLGPLVWFLKIICIYIEMRTDIHRQIDRDRPIDREILTDPGYVCIGY